MSQVFVASYLEIARPISLRLGNNKIGNTTWNHFVLVSTARSGIEAASPQIQFGLEPRDGEPAEDEPCCPEIITAS
jgi:hypothetical protein